MIRVAVRGCFIAVLLPASRPQPVNFGVSGHRTEHGLWGIMIGELSGTHPGRRAWSSVWTPTSAGRLPWFQETNLAVCVRRRIDAVARFDPRAARGDLGTLGPDFDSRVGHPPSDRREYDAPDCSPPGVSRCRSEPCSEAYIHQGD